MFLTKVKYLYSLAIIFILTSSFANASANPIEIKFLGVSIQERAERAIEFLLGIAGSLALFLLVGSGIYYMSVNGNPEAQKKAKKMLIAVLIGVVVILLSYALILLTNKILVE